MTKYINTIVIGGGQAGLAASEHLSNKNIKHIIFERDRIVERWRTSRWDSLVANGPAWHDRFPTLKFANIDPDSFASKEMVVKYFEKFAKKIKAPINLNVNVEKVEKQSSNHKYLVTTSEGLYEADNIIVATGAFQEPIIPNIIPSNSKVNQIHSQAYKNPEQFSDGSILVIGSGSSGSQIAEELRRTNREVFF